MRLPLEMKTARAPFTSLLLLLQFSLVMRGCSASFEIIQHPVSQVVIAGKVASFHCTAKASGSSSFDLVLHPTFRASSIYITTDTPTPDWMNKSIELHYDRESDETTYTASVTIEGSEATNRTTLICRVFDYMSNSVPSRTAELTVIGPPNTPSVLSLPPDMESKQFSAVWNVPFSHTNHSISGYTVAVSSLNQTEAYERSLGPETPLPDSGPVQVTLPFPPHTSSCHILHISVSALNDIGSSEPASALLFIPKVPADQVSAAVTVHFNSRNTVVILTEIKFPEFCWFERVNYSVVLEELSGERGRLIQVAKSVQNPRELVSETITAGVVANTNYSIVVAARTHWWNSSTTPHNFTTHPSESPTATSINAVTPSFEGVSSGSEKSGISLPVVAAVAGTVGCLLLLIAGVLTLICIFRSRHRRPGLPISIEDMKISSVPHDLTPNPIYDGPLYETVRDAVPQPLTFKPELLPLPPTPSTSQYTESPTLNKHRQISTNDEMEDAYVQMNTCKRK